MTISQAHTGCFSMPMNLAGYSFNTLQWSEGPQWITPGGCYQGHGTIKEGREENWTAGERILDFE